MAIQGYNAQVVANEQQVILAADLTAQANDQRQLGPMLQATKRSLRAAGISEPIQTVLADGAYFQLDAIAAARDAGITALIPPSDPDPNAERPRPLRDGPVAAQMRATLQTPEGQQLYRRRQVIVEPVFARTKHHRQITRLLKRGLAACQAEWKLIATTHNLLKLYSATPQAA
jgi:hypothetical protein